MGLHASRGSEAPFASFLLWNARSEGAFALRACLRGRRAGTCLAPYIRPKRACTKDRL
jgi:hypothetical protein